jgi:hypothetical protein
MSEKREWISAGMQREKQQVRLLGLFKPVQQSLLLGEQGEGVLRPKGQPEIVEYSEIRLENKNSGSRPGNRLQGRNWIRQRS